VIPSQRETIIHNLLQQHGVVTVAEICTHCNCSPETARRDLRRLEEKGMVVRTHGGATTIETSVPGQNNPNGASLLEARSALTDRADALIVSPNETKATHLLVERSRRAGVPIIAEATNYPGAQTVVSVDNYRAGFEAGQWVVNYARHHFGGKIVVLDVSYPQPNTNARSCGFADGLRELSPGQRTVFSVDGQGLRESARRITADALTVHPEINVIFGINDDSALGALDAYRAADLDEGQLLVVSFGMEGDTAKELLEQATPYTIGVAMFPELVGRACVDASICAYHGCALPERVTTPFAIVTPETLNDFYERNEQTGKWSLNWARAEQLPTASPGLELLRQCHHRPKPKRVGYVEIFSSHEWYQNVRRAMQDHCCTIGVCLEVMDASQDMAHEIHALKQSIGHAAARFVHEGDTIIVDAGVTTSYLAQALRDRHCLTVITNSLPVLAELENEKGITLVASGGVVRPESRSMTGPEAEATFQKLRATKAFISATGLSVDFGLSNTNIPEATVKQAMIGAAREVILLADYTKIGVESLVKIAPLDHIHRLITNMGISSHDRLALTQRGIEVSIADDSFGM
jgi:DeoR/GlpR family transcriptional regulator of sugar metabolism